MKMKWYTVAAAIGAVAILASCNAAASIPTTLQVTVNNTVVYNNGSYAFPTMSKSGTLSANFTIKNTSTTDTIHLTAGPTGNPVYFTDTTYFKVQTQPSTTIPPGQSVSFTIQNNPYTGSNYTAGSTYSSTLRIYNDASDTTPFYQFALSITLN